MQTANVLGLARVCMHFEGYYPLIGMEELHGDNTISHSSKGSQHCSYITESQIFCLIVFTNRNSKSYSTENKAS